MPTQPNNFESLYREGQRPCFIKKWKAIEGTMFDAATARNSKGTGWYGEFCLREKSKYVVVNRLRDFLINICRFYKSTNLDVALPRFIREFKDYEQQEHDEAMEQSRHEAFCAYDDWKRDVLENTDATDIVDSIGVDASACPYDFGTIERADWIEERALELCTVR